MAKKESAAISLVIQARRPMPEIHPVVRVRALVSEGQAKLGDRAANPLTCVLTRATARRHYALDAPLSE